MINCDLRKLDLFGIEYFHMLMLEEQRRSDYRIYLTDVLKGLAERVYNISGLNAEFQRYYDFTRRSHIDDDPDPEDKLDEIVNAAGLTLI